MVQINLDLQTQVFVLAGVALASIIISFITLLLYALLLLKVNRLSRRVGAQASAPESAAAAAKRMTLVDPQFQSPVIHPREELGLRGFVKLPTVRIDPNIT